MIGTARCPGCDAYVEPVRNGCPECGTACYEYVDPAQHRGIATPERNVEPVSGLVRECLGCGRVVEHRPRSDNGRPQSRCPECMRSYLREWRAQNWRVVKARETWRGMLRRCNDPAQGKGYARGVPRFADYGAKGIRVCARWQGEGGFARFVRDVGLPPTRAATLDRRDPRRNYTKSNCRWVDLEFQQANKRSTRWVEVPGPDGEVLIDSLAGWSRRTGIPWTTIRGRLDRGWDARHAVTVPSLRGSTLIRYLSESVPF